MAELHVNEMQYLYQCISMPGIIGMDPILCIVAENYCYQRKLFFLASMNLDTAIK